MVYLLPQINDSIASEIAFDLSARGKCNASDIFKDVDGKYFNPTAGEEINIKDLNQLREEIISEAKIFGFPSERGKSFLEFEYKVAIIFSEFNQFWINEYPTGETLRNDFWSYFSLVVMPDVSIWRWPIPQSEEKLNSWVGRMIGGSRNVFQRIFRRLICLDRGYKHPNRLDLIKNLKEDDFSNILERTSLSGNSLVAISLAEEFLAMRERNSKFQKEVYRPATKDLLAYGKVQSLDLLDKEDLEKLISSVFNNRESEYLEKQKINEEE